MHSCRHPCILNYLGAHLPEVCPCVNAMHPELAAPAARRLVVLCCWVPLARKASPCPGHVQGSSNCYMVTELMFCDLAHAVMEPGMSEQLAWRRWGHVIALDIASGLACEAGQHACWHLCATQRADCGLACRSARYQECGEARPSQVP